MGLIKQSIPTKLLDKNGMRLDGRKLDELRPTKLEMGTLKRADGSAYIEQGKNKILVAVYGPRDLHPHHLCFQTDAYCDVFIAWRLSRLRKEKVQHLAVVK